jgi:hypothetical protein
MALQSDNKRIWDPGQIHVRNDRIYEVAMSGQTDMEEGEESESRTELDSHANMAVVGKHCYVLVDHGKTISVSPFSPEYKPLEVPWLIVQSSIAVHTTERITSWCYGMPCMLSR